MPGTAFLEGEDIKLRTIEEEDLKFLRDGVNHPEVRVHMGNRNPQNMENQQEFFEEVICGDENVNLLITKNKERLGIISLNDEGNKADRTAEIGLWLHPEHHGNGYGTEAVELITSYGFEQLNYHKIYARAHADNDASLGLWEKLGFEKEGEFRDHTYTMGEYRDVVYYGVLEEEW